MIVYRYCGYMKTKILYLFILFTFLFSACDESSTSVFRLDEEEFTREMKDSLIFNVETDGNAIQFTGKLSLIDGKCDVWLTYPVYDTVLMPDTLYLTDTIFAFDGIFNGDSLFSIDTVFVTDSIIVFDTLFNAKVIYSKTFMATDNFSIDEKFDRVKGEWIFRYQLKSIDDVQPSGNLDFKIVYND